MKTRSGGNTLIVYPGLGRKLSRQQITIQFEDDRLWMKNDKEMFQAGRKLRFFLTPPQVVNHSQFKNIHHINQPENSKQDCCNKRCNQKDP